MYLALHIVDRSLFAELGPDRRAKVMDTLVPLTIGPNMYGLMASVGADPASDQAKGLVEAAHNDYNVRSIEYSRCKDYLTTHKDQSLAGTLLWEFSRKALDPSGYRDDPAIFLPVIGVAAAMLKALNAPAAVEALRAAQRYR
jgi:hypothetical protein